MPQQSSHAETGTPGSQIMLFKKDSPFEKTRVIPKLQQERNWIGNKKIRGASYLEWKKA